MMLWLDDWDIVIFSFGMQEFNWFLDETCMGFNIIHDLWIYSFGIQTDRSKLTLTKHIDKFWYLNFCQIISFIEHP
jgi:hypothetical protein